MVRRRAEISPPRRGSWDMFKRIEPYDAHPAAPLIACPHRQANGHVVIPSGSETDPRAKRPLGVGDDHRVTPKTPAGAIGWKMSYTHGKIHGLIERAEMFQ